MLRYVFFIAIFFSSLSDFIAQRSSAQKGEGVFDKFYDFRDIVDTTIHSGEPHNANVVINDMLVIPGDRLQVISAATIVHLP